MSKCRGCGATLAPTNGRGRQRLWCSDRCRRRTLYVTPCRTCGAKVYDGTANPPNECGGCKHERLYGEQNRRIRQLWRRGATAPEIGQELGLPAVNVSARIQAWREGGESIPRHTLPHRDRAERYERIAELWNAEAPTAEIAKQIGTTPESVLFMVGRAREMGYDITSRGSRHDPTEIERLWKQGNTLQELAGLLGISTTGAASLVTNLRRRGYDLPNRRNVKNKVAVAA